MTGALDYGDVPTWIGAITTGAALVSALVLFRRQSEVLSTTVEELRRSQAGPAAGVCVWKSVERGAASLEVWNTAEFPVTGVVVTLTDGGLERRIEEFSTVFPPGERESSTLPTADPTGARVRVDFTDAFGVRWRRTPNSLDMVSGEER